MYYTFNYFLLAQVVRFLLLPFSALYGVVVTLRGWLFDRGILRGERAKVPTLVVGNLAVGGTGKSPLSQELLLLIHRHGAVGFLSRGYGRKSKGFYMVEPNSDTLTVGDEPLMIRRIVPEGIPMAVCEDRVEGCRQLLLRCPHLRCIVLDDAYQHRRLKADTSLLLTSYNRLYRRDFYLPSGRLRDTPRQAKRARAIIVTKCPATLTPEQAGNVVSKLQANANQEVLFTITERLPLYPLDTTSHTAKLSSNAPVIAIAAIANPKPFFAWAKSQWADCKTIQLRDHQQIPPRVIRRLQQAVGEKRRLIVTTRKDAVRLKEALSPYPNLIGAVWVAPIGMRWLFDGKKKIERIIDELLQSSNTSGGTAE